ncbi:hypothetical protein T10_6585 [Trichinella papuae]|uniref:Uncharacterized protein n=1 Tax=Trichinella papuae TaxID=268474 RepID=A0A0V1N142_9BILA|nr:hypothetical protein T10_6585 [Trichinella papuae]
MVDHSPFFYVTVTCDFQLCKTVKEVPHWKCIPESCTQRKFSQDVSYVRVSLTVEMGIATLINNMMVTILASQAAEDMPIL